MKENNDIIVAQLKQMISRQFPLFSPSLLALINFCLIALLIAAVKYVHLVSIKVLLSFCVVYICFECVFWMRKVWDNYDKRKEILLSVKHLESVIEDEKSR